MLSNVDVNLRIQSNVSYPVTISLFGNNFNLRDTTNAKTEYRWDVTGLTFASNQNVTLQYKQASAASFSNFTGSYQENTLTSILIFLNTLGIGYFTTYIETGNTYISTYNDNYVFGNLTIDGAVAASIINPAFSSGTGFDDYVTWIKEDSTGKVVLCGRFTAYNGNSAERLVRISNVGTYDATFDTTSGFDSGVSHFYIDASDNVFCVGAFNNYDVNPSNWIAKLDSTANYDNTFNVGTGLSGSFGGSGSGNDVYVDIVGNVYIVGNFTDYNGTSINGIIKTDNTGNPDLTFVGNVGTAFNDSVICIAVTNDDKILIGGTFTDFNGNTRKSIVKLNKDGTENISTNFGSGFDDAVLCLYCYTTGDFLIGGLFTNYDGTPNQNKLVKLTNTGTFAAGFSTGTGFSGGGVSGIDVNESTGKIVVTGNFTSYNGTVCNGIVRLNSDGSIDTTWNYGTGLAGGAARGYDVQLLTNNTYLLGGDFTSFDGTSAINVVSLLTS